MEVKLTLLVLVAVALLIDNPVIADYLWHNDEIPYDPKAKCFRGYSYYSNSLTANNTDIDLGTEIESLLDYNNENTCFFCICSVSGYEVGCVNRDISYCNELRVYREAKTIRDRYTKLLGQDRPTYFRQLSWRMRRNMDNGVFALLKIVGIDEQGNKKKCIPFVSEYSNCNDANLCTGCTRCFCNSDAEWVCKDVKECMYEGPAIDPPSTDPNIMAEDADEIFDNALDMLQFEMEKRKSFREMSSKDSSARAPTPYETKSHNDIIENTYKPYQMEDVMAALSRSKRSTADKTEAKIKTTDINNGNVTANNNKTIFFDTVDELNEDTLKGSNATGTLIAEKVAFIPKIQSRRSGDGENTTKSLQIEYNQPKPFPQITDNKIDTPEHEIKFDESHESLKVALGNQSQVAKDQDLSKLVVNELKNGSEVIGDANAPVTSNITFTSENDTLTAMAFIAGNLLNKLWSMEKDASGSSMETDVIKNQKIMDLLDLFKEPLNLRQEMFLKTALEQLSAAMNKDQTIKNVSFCETIEEAKKALFNKNESEEAVLQEVTTTPANAINEQLENKQQQVAAVEAISKINNVLELIRKFETIQGNITVLKRGPKLNFNLSKSTLKDSGNKKLIPDISLTKEEKSSLNLFGGIVEKITRLLMPNRNSKSVSKQMKSLNSFGNHENLKKKFKKLYNIDLSNMTVTAKDKLVLDYLTHIDSNPSCLLKRNKKKLPDSLSSLSTINGNILLNLSEFFKLKSFGDLIKLLNPDKTEIAESSTSLTTVLGETRKSTSPITVNIQDDSNKLNTTKEKLKAHLKTIIEDLVDLQKAKGGNVKGNFKIEDVLPCIYNMLNVGKETNTVQALKETNPIKEVAKMFKELKKEMKAAKTRRTNVSPNVERPKSAAIWQRIMKNLKENSNQNQRRANNNERTPKSFSQIKAVIDRLENSSATYKRNALRADVPPVGRMVMLKALELDVLTSIMVLEDIKLAYDNLSKLPPNQLQELLEFISNVEISTNVNEKISKKLKESPKTVPVPVYALNAPQIVPKPIVPVMRTVPIVTQQKIIDDGKFRVSRDQIMNQLIRNRVELYLKAKEGREYGPNDDVNYNIAKRILFYLDTGSQDLAQELFKIFVMKKESNMVPVVSPIRIENDKYFSTTTPRFTEYPLFNSLTQPKQGVLQFNNPNTINKQVNWVDQDRLIQQLMNLKNMRPA